MKILIVEARFYEDIADELAAGAEAVLEKAGVSYDRVAVPGALEIPAAIRFALDGGKYDGFVALGCVIRGETSHYDIVCGESARGLTWLAIEHKAAIGNGILTVEDFEQAHERSRPDRLNKGGGAAETCLALVELKKKLGVAETG